MLSLAWVKFQFAYEIVLEALSKCFKSMFWAWKSANASNTSVNAYAWSTNLSAWPHACFWLFAVKCMKSMSFGIVSIINITDLQIIIDNQKNFQYPSINRLIISTLIYYAVCFHVLGVYISVITSIIGLLHDHTCTCNGLQSSLSCCSWSCRNTGNTTIILYYKKN